jgi:hypothetical protein
MTKNKTNNEITFKTKPKKCVVIPIGYKKGEYDRLYLTVKQISELTNQSTRNVRRIIFDILEDEGPCTIHKDGNLKWRVHQLALDRFAPTRKKWVKRYALTIHLHYCYLESDIHRIMKFVLDNTKDDKLEINYSLHGKGNQFDVNCFVKSNGKKKLYDSIHEAFSRAICIRDNIYDFKDWSSYITLDNA